MPEVRHRHGHRVGPDAGRRSSAVLRRCVRRGGRHPADGPRAGRGGGSRRRHVGGRRGAAAAGRRGWCPLGGRDRHRHRGQRRLAAARHARRRRTDHHRRGTRASADGTADLRGSRIPLFAYPDHHRTRARRAAASPTGSTTWSSSTRTPRSTPGASRPHSVCCVPAGYWRSTTLSPTAASATRPPATPKRSRCARWSSRSAGRTRGFRRCCPPVPACSPPSSSALAPLRPADRETTPARPLAEGDAGAHRRGRTQLVSGTRGEAPPVALVGEGGQPPQQGAHTPPRGALGQLAVVTVGPRGGRHVEMHPAVA